MDLTASAVISRVYKIIDQLYIGESLLLNLQLCSVMN